MEAPKTPANEAERLAKLRSYGILDTEGEQAFEDLVQLAAAVCGTPISAISLVDSDRQWFKAQVGLADSQTTRDVSFCGHTIHGTDLTVVENALDDARFADNPLVTADPHIRFYAGAPLLTPDGFALGSLCVIDRRPRTLAPEQSAALSALSRQCMQLLELRVANRRMEALLREREAALEAQQASEAHLQALTDSALDAIVAADARGLIVSWNPAAEEIFGYARAEIVGRPIADIMPEHHRQAHSRGLGRVAAGGPSKLAGQRLQLQGLRKDGVVFDLEMSLGTWISPDGRFFGAVMRDVTAARRAEAAVRDERDFTAAVLDATDAIIIVTAPDGVITRFNGAAERASGYSAAEAVGRRFDFLVPPEDLADLGQRFSNLMAGQASRHRVRAWQRKDGTRMTISWSSGLLTDASGAVTHVIGAGIDLTDQRRAEAEVERQSAIIASVLGNMTDAVILTDEKGDFVVYNDAARQMIGRGPEDGPPDTWPDQYGLYLPDGKTRLPFEQIPMVRALRGEHVEQFEIFLRAPMFPDGRWHSVTASPVRAGAGERQGTGTGPILGTISVGRDITDRKRAEETLARQSAELRELALRDELTGLRNRRAFMVIAEQHLRQALRKRRPALVVFIDLDGMKGINDRLGHEEGDQALRDTAVVLRAVFRDADVVARLGGDEFVALLPEADQVALDLVRERMQIALHAHNERSGKPYELAMSVGATCFDPFAPQSVEALLASADAVMYAHKQERRARATGVRAVVTG